VKISVVIATRDRRDTLLRTLPTVLDQTLDASEFEVIVVVDGSTDGTVAALASLDASNLRRLEQEHAGPAVARNAALAVATGELVLFLDDDIRCDRDLLDAHLRAHAVGEWIVHGRIDVAPESPRTLAAASTATWYQDRHEQLLQSAASVSSTGYALANTSLPRRLVVDAGGFDPAIAFPREDFELALRLRGLGVAFAYQPAARAYEIFVKSTARFARDGRTSGRADVALTRRHPAFRPSSLLVLTGSRSPWKRRVLKAFLRMHVPPALLFRVPVAVAERLQRLARVRSLGIGLMGLWYHLEAQVGAREATGGKTAFEQEFGREISVLFHHRVGPPDARIESALTVSPPDFERQIDWLAKHGYTTIAPDEWFRWCTEGRPLPAKPVLLTFDDGYADLTEYAFPVLERHGFRAGVFAVSDELGGAYSWDEYGRGFSLVGAPALREWSGRGIEVGAHSRSHPHLDALGDAEVEDEVVGSRRVLSDALELPVRSFAYPYGAYDDRALQHVRATYDVAFTVQEGLDDLGTDLHQLRRTMVHPGASLFEFGLQVRLGWNPVQRLRERFAQIPGRRRAS
jgi:peptidoglycan/xylan/chitin deacetylase (PgdA/CDA1 family)/glycosyltransferase involved in cell wall biosynthesis